MAQPIKNFIRNEDSQFARILKKATFLQSLNKNIAKHLPPDLAQHCCVSSLEAGILRIAVENAAFLLQLRYNVADLLAQFQLDNTLPEIKDIEFYIDAGWKLASKSVS